MTEYTALTPLDIAAEYIQRGWNPVVVPYKGKIPSDDGEHGTKDWQKRVITLANVAQYFNGRPQNVGVAMGPLSKGLTDIDCDCPEAITMAAFVLPKTGAIFGRKSARFAHYLYKTNLAGDDTLTGGSAVLKFSDEQLIRSPGPKAGKKATLVELRIGGDKGAQTVFPGSTHSSGEVIVWEEAGEPALVDGAELLRLVKLIAVGAMFIRYWPADGKRHDAALAIGAFMARATDETPEWIQYFVERVAQAAGCGDGADTKRSAYDSAKSTRAGGKTFGLPTIKQLFGDHVGDSVAQWLNYQGDGQGHGSPRVPEPFAPTAEPVDPVDLWAKFDPPSLPKGLLPDTIECFAFDQGRAMGADMAGIAMAALAVCAGAIPDKIKLQVKRHHIGWMESARIWVTIVGDPSTKKSPAMLAAVSPLRRMDAEMARNNARARADHDKLPKEEKRITEPPKQPRLVIEDVTIEAAQEVLRDSPDGVLCYQDELTGWFGSMDKYSGGGRAAMKDRGFWLQSFNGGTYGVNRIMRGSSFIENLSVSMLGGIQPEPIRKLADESSDDGLLQRLLPIMLTPAVESTDEPMSGSVTDYSALIGKLRHLGDGGEVTLRFDEGAQVYRQELERRHIDLMGLVTVNRKLASHIGKYDGIFARLCVIWHCVEASGTIGTIPTVIPERTARRVGAFLHGFLLRHAMAFYTEVLGLSNGHDDMEAVAGFILARGLTNITPRDIQRGDRSMRRLAGDRRAMEAVLDGLDALGWVEKVPDVRPNAPGKWKVNPAVHAKFEKRAVAEKARRARDRKMIGEVLGRQIE